jgi:hypothetical protein
VFATMNLGISAGASGTAFWNGEQIGKEGRVFRVPRIKSKGLVAKLANWRWNASDSGSPAVMKWIVAAAAVWLTRHVEAAQRSSSQADRLMQVHCDHVAQTQWSGMVMQCELVGGGPNSRWSTVNSGHRDE